MLNSYIRDLIARRHIAGPELHNALEVCKLAASNGWSTCISVWTRPGEDKKSVADKYIKIINTISQNGMESYLSIKPSALQFDFNLFEYIAKEVQDDSVRIHFDSLLPDLAADSIQYFHKAKKIYGNVGFTIPARWLRSINDAEEISGMNVPVRIVKGQWQDPDDIRINTEENFLKIISKLINKIPLIAIATHDLHLAEKAIQILSKSNTEYELEQFFSLPILGKVIQSRSNNNNVKIRIYVAYGEPYLPYNLRTVKQRPAMIGWFLRDLLNLKPRFSTRSNNRMELNHENITV